MGVMPRDGDSPIDLVFTWVDGDDPAYVATRQAYAARELAPDLARSEHRDRPVRYVNVGELPYSVNSVTRYLPWVRTVFVVTDAPAPPIPAELLQSGKVRVIDLRAIVPHQYLPTFNSIVIESCLHRIEGLSEIYLCSNDDYMHFASVPRAAFCDAGAGPETPLTLRVTPAFTQWLRHLASRVWSMNGRMAHLHAIGIANAFRLLRSGPHRVPFRDIVLPWHATHVARRSTARRIEEEFAAELDANRRHRFRSPHGFSYHTLQCTMERRWHPEDRVYCPVLDEPRHRFEMFDFDGMAVRGNTEKVWQRVLRSRAQFACLNNVPKHDQSRFADVMRAKGLSAPSVSPSA